MTVVSRVLAALSSLPFLTATAWASQGPGTTGGTADGTDRVILAVVVLAAIGVGFAVKFSRHQAAD